MRKLVPNEFLIEIIPQMKNAFLFVFVLENILFFVGFQNILRRNARRMCVCSPECVNLFLFLLKNLFRK